jgi:hypothetical protein
MRKRCASHTTKASIARVQQQPHGQPHEQPHEQPAWQPHEHAHFVGCSIKVVQ